MKKILIFIMVLVGLCEGSLFSQAWTDLSATERIPIKGTSNFQGWGVVEQVQIISSSVSGNPSIIFAKNSAGIWKSIDAGQSFVCITNESQSGYVQIANFYVNPRDENEIIISSRGYPNPKVSISRSLDGGQTWNDFSYSKDFGNGVNSFALDISNTSSDVLYVTTNKGLYHIDLRNTTASLNWALNVDANNNLLDDQFVQVYFVKKRNQNEFFCYANNNDHVYKRDASGVWEEISLSGIPTSHSNLLTSIGRDGTFYARMKIGSRAWIYLYDSNTSTWTQLSGSSTGVDDAGGLVWRFLVSPHNDDIIFYNVPSGPGSGGALGYYNAQQNSAYYSGGYRTSDCANTHADVQSIAFDPENDTKLYAGNDGFVSRFNATVNNSSSNAVCADWDYLACKGITGGRWGGGIATSPDNANVVIMNCWHNLYSITNLNGVTKNWEALDYLTGELGVQMLIISSEGEESIIVNRSAGGRDILLDLINHNTTSRISGKTANVVPFSSRNYDGEITNIRRDPFIKNCLYVSTRKSIKKYENIHAQAGNIYHTQTSLNVPSFSEGENIKSFVISDIDNTKMYLITRDGNNITKTYASELNSAGQLIWNSGYVIPASVRAKASLIHRVSEPLAVSYKNSNALFLTARPINASAAPYVFVSEDQGQNWSEYKTEGLPNTSTGANHIDIPEFLLSEKGANDGLFLGMQEGLYYTDATMNSWVRYGDTQDLPGFNIGYGRGEVNYISNELYVHGSRPRKVGLKCPSVSNLNVSSITNEGWYEAKDKVTVDANTGNSNKYWVRSTSEIELTDGFSAESGTDASFFIHGCGGRSTKNGNALLRQSFVDLEPEINLEDDVSNNLTYREQVMDIYPNPTTGPFNIKLNLKEGELAQEVTLRDYSGNLLFKTDDIPGGNEIEITDYYDVERGQIIIELTTTESRYSRKLVYGILGAPYEEDK